MSNVGAIERFKLDEDGGIDEGRRLANEPDDTIAVVVVKVDRRALAQIRLINNFNDA